MAEPSILGALRDPQFRSDTLRNLVEALNGAKRSLTVGSLGAVGDMGNTLANLVRAGAGTAYHETTGRPIPQALEYRDPARDFGTSASLGNFAEQQGWLPPQTGSIPETAGALLGPIAAMKAPDLAQSTLRGLVSALKSEPSRRMVEGYMSGMGMKPQAIVYHGSPHQFDAFDSSKIGTGEGAQAYGHGLYLAESPNVAKSYQDELAGRGYRASIVQNGRNSYSVVNPNGVVLADGVMLGQAHRAKSAHDAAQTGALYKVDLPDPLIARMLDWDKPLSQQAPEVRGLLRKQGVSGKEWDVQAIGNGPQGNLNDRFVFDSATEARKKLTELRAQGYYARPFGDAFSANKTGADFVKNMSDPAIQAERLRAMGIPGIRYLDGGSRADGAGTSNFVVFPGEESALTILERNGKPVPLRDLLKGPAEATQFPQDAALATAHRNGVGMLGLPENHTPMDRARALGFDTDAVHFSRHGIDATELDSGKYAVAPFDAIGTHVGTIESARDRFRNTVGTTDQAKGSSYPVLIRRGDEFISPNGGAWNEDALNAALIERGGYENARETYQSLNAKLRKDLFKGSGYDSIPYVNDVEGKGSLSHIVPPWNIRSRFAAFDPARRNESDLLASFAGAGILSPLVLEQLAEPRDKKDMKRK